MEEETTLFEYPIQGHRGCRGMMPENSIEGFIHAVKLGVNTIEMDVVISKDHQVVVSHEPVMSYRKCLLPNGKQILREEENMYNIYKLNYDEIKQFDCGSLPNETFPKQENFTVYKPLLSEVLSTIEERFPLRDIHYNIEIKSTPEGDGVYHPKPKKFCELVMGEVRRQNLQSRVILQSFDIRILQYLKQSASGIRLALLVENELSFEENLDRLGFIPHIYSPWYPFVNQELVEKCRNKNMKIIPWTVNDRKHIKRMIALEVDEIITDYPNYFTNKKPREK